MRSARRHRRRRDALAEIKQDTDELIEQGRPIAQRCLKPPDRVFQQSVVEAARPAALLWSLERGGSRSGRVAYQFARDYAGQHERS